MRPHLENLYSLLHTGKLSNPGLYSHNLGPENFEAGSTISWNIGPINRASEYLLTGNPDWWMRFLKGSLFDNFGLNGSEQMSSVYVQGSFAAVSVVCCHAKKLQHTELRSLAETWIRRQLAILTMHTVMYQPPIQDYDDNGKPLGKLTQNPDYKGPFVASPGFRSNWEHSSRSPVSAIVSHLVGLPHVIKINKRTGRPGIALLGYEVVRDVMVKYKDDLGVNGAMKQALWKFPTERDIVSIYPYMEGTKFKVSAHFVETNSGCFAWVDRNGNGNTPPTLGTSCFHVTKQVYLLLLTKGRDRQGQKAGSCVYDTKRNVLHGEGAFDDTPYPPQEIPTPPIGTFKKTVHITPDGTYLEIELNAPAKS